MKYFGLLLLVAMAGETRGQTIWLNGLRVENGTGIGYNWSSDFSPNSGHDNWSDHGRDVSVVYGAGDPANPFTLSLSRSQGSGYFPLPVNVSGSMVFNVTGTGTVPTTLQTVELQLSGTNGHTNQYGFGIAGGGTYYFQFIGTPGTIFYWAVEWTVTVTVENSNGSASFNMITGGNTGTVSQFNQTVNASGTYTGSAYGSDEDGGYGFSTRLDGSIGVNQSDVTLVETVRYAFSTTPITSISAIPEPAVSVAGFGSAALGLALWRRRRARAVVPPLSS
jgi:hypothetical protein